MKIKGEKETQNKVNIFIWFTNFKIDQMKNRRQRKKLTEKGEAKKKKKRKPRKLINWDMKLNVKGCEEC
jgi:hypothetical protein